MEVGGLVHGLYILAAVFGGGVTAIDLLGLLGGHDDSPSDGGHGGDGHAADGADGHDGDAHGDGHGSSILVLMRKLRLLVYFCLGFGLLGLAAEFTGSGLLGSLAWAVPGGLACAWMARMFFRFQSRDIDSSLRDHELLLQPGEVIIGLDSRDMGKVRARLGQITVERYALAEDEGQAFRVGDAVEIVRVADDCVYVRRAAG